MNRAPEPTEQDIARAAAATAKEVFDGSDGKLTVAYYRRLRAVGPMGVVCLNLMRAQKTSFRAKMYRGRQYRNASYETKNFSLSELVKALENVQQITWGWQHDPNTPGFEWCLYCELPTGQCSFHSASRLSGPDFTGKWDGIKGGSVTSILMFCDMVLGREVPDNRPC